MAKRTRKIKIEEPPEEQPQYSNLVKVYKVCYCGIPMMPMTGVTIRVFFTEVEARSFIMNYYNVFMIPFLQVREEIIAVNETD